MVGVRDGVEVYGVVCGRGVVSECEDGLGPSRGHGEVESDVDSRVGPDKTSGDAKRWEGGGEEGGERGGDWDGGSIEGRGVIGGE